MAETKSNAVAQSSIGLQIFYYDTAEYKFKYLVPLTGDLPALGSAPSQIEVTEADSPVKQYISDRPDSPAIELTYNYLPKHEKIIHEHLNPASPNIFALLLPLGSAKIILATGDTWLNGGSPIQGAMNLTQSQKAISIDDITTTLTTEVVEQLKAIGVKKGSMQEVSTSDKGTDLFDWATIPEGKISQAPKE